MDVRRARAGDRQWIDSSIRSAWGSSKIAIRNELVDLAWCPALIAGDRQGLLHYRSFSSTAGEILALEAFERGLGIGSTLVHAYRALAAADGLASLVVVTTNDNTNALRFYQRLGFVLSEVRLGAVTDARKRLKPEIPLQSENGIPIRDEIELRLIL